MLFRKQHIVKIDFLLVLMDCNVSRDLSRTVYSIRNQRCPKKKLVVIVTPYGKNDQ